MADEMRNFESLITKLECFTGFVFVLRANSTLRRSFGCTTPFLIWLFAKRAVKKYVIWVCLVSMNFTGLASNGVAVRPISVA